VKPVDRRCVGRDANRSTMHVEAFPEVLWDAGSIPAASSLKLLSNDAQVVARQWLTAWCHRGGIGRAQGIARAFPAIQYNAGYNSFRATAVRARCSELLGLIGRGPPTTSLVAMRLVSFMVVGRLAHRCRQTGRRTHAPQ
jgi:hypothetical protein